MSVARTSVMLMSILVGACATVTPGNEPYELITGESLRATVVGKIVTFPKGEALTGTACYIFRGDGRALHCSRGDFVDYGRFVLSDDRVCTDFHDSLCWQFYRSRTAGYLIRHLAITPQAFDEPVCIEAWTRELEPCRLPSPRS
jgi:hypothetical protein